MDWKDFLKMNRTMLIIFLVLTTIYLLLVFTNGEIMHPDSIFKDRSTYGDVTIIDQPIQVKFFEKYIVYRYSHVGGCTDSIPSYCQYYYKFNKLSMLHILVLSVLYLIICTVHVLIKKKK